MSITTTGRSPHHGDRAEVVEYRLTMGLAYVLFLAVAVVNRLVPRRFRANIAGLDGKRSIFSEARTAASSCIPFAYK